MTIKPEEANSLLSSRNKSVLQFLLRDYCPDGNLGIFSLCYFIT